MFVNPDFFNDNQWRHLDEILLVEKGSLAIPCFKAWTDWDHNNSKKFRPNFKPLKSSAIPEKSIIMHEFGMTNTWKCGFYTCYGSLKLFLFNTVTIFYWYDHSICFSMRNVDWPVKMNSAIFQFERWMNLEPPILFFYQFLTFL